MNQFTERYKQKSNSELVKIINNSYDYQELAINTAKEELRNRGIIDYNNIEQEINNNTIEKNDYNSNPIQDSLKLYFLDKSNEDKILIGICIVIIPWSLFMLYAAFSLLKFTFANGRYGGLIFIAFLILPTISTILFTRKIKFGWILISFLFTYSVVESITKYLNAYLYNTEGMLNSFIFGVIFGTFQYLICQPKFREIYKVKDKLMWLTIGLSTCVSITFYQIFIN